MKRILLLFIILFLCNVPRETFAQTNGVQVLCCGNSAKDTARFKRKVWIDSSLRLTFYSNSDDTKFLTVNQYGVVELRTVSGGGGSTVNSVNGEVGDVVLTTTDIAEGANLYFTNVRADARVAAALVDYYTSGQIDAILDDYLTTADAATTYVPLARTLTINGTAYDLTANRSWTITSTTTIYNKWGNIIFGLDSVATDTSLVTSRARAKKIGDSVAALIPTNNNQLTNGAAYITRAGVSATAPLTYNVTTGVFDMPAGSSSVSGYISSTDWQAFNAKQAALSGTGFVKISGSTISYDNTTYYPNSNPNSWIGLGAISALAPLVWNSTTGQMSIPQASGSVSGYLSSTDWTTFNNKQASGTYIQYILSGFAITATGTTSVTIGVDSALVATRLRVQKAVDSLNAVLGNYVTWSSVNSISTTSYTLQASDRGKIVAFSNSAAITLTIPTSLGATFYCTIQQNNTGQVTFTASGTVLHVYGGGTKTGGQYAQAVINFTPTADTYDIQGATQ